MPWGMRGVKIRGSTLAYHSPADNRVGLNAAGTGRHFLRPRLRGAFHALPGQFRLQPKAKPLCGRLGALLFPFIAICSSILSHRSIRVNSCQVKMYNQIPAAGSGGRDVGMGYGVSQASIPPRNRLAHKESPAIVLTLYQERFWKIVQFQ